MAGRARVGVVEDDVLHLHEGDLFDCGGRTGETVALSQSALADAPRRRPRWWRCGTTSAPPRKRTAGPYRPNRSTSSRRPIRSTRTASRYGRPAPMTAAVAYEGELGIVIGKTCTACPGGGGPRSRLRLHLCERLSRRWSCCSATRRFPQWTRAKNFDTFGVFGPVVSTALDPLCLDDPHAGQRTRAAKTTGRTT